MLNRSASMQELAAEVHAIPCLRVTTGKSYHLVLLLTLAVVMTLTISVTGSWVKELAHTGGLELNEWSQSPLVWPDILM